MGVESLSLLICVVGRGLFNFPKKVLLDVKLPHVRDGAALDSVVGQELGAVMDDCLVGLAAMCSEAKPVLTMEVVCTTNVVPWDDSCEGRSTILTSRLNTTQRIGGHGGSRAITVALGLDARIYTSRVAAPELDICIGNWLATRSVNHVDVEMGYSALLASKDI